MTSNFTYVVVGFMNARDVIVVSRHSKADLARASARRNDLNEELNVVELRSDWIPIVGEVISRITLEDRSLPVPRDQD